MFGLEGQRKKKKGAGQEFVFDLETELLKDAKRDKELKADIEKRIQQLKTILRAGEEKEDYDKYGLLLLGYAALLKVVMRVTLKRK